jgi:hypothetical protein
VSKSGILLYLQLTFKAAFFSKTLPDILIRNSF